MNFKNQKSIIEIDSDTIQLRYILGGLASPFNDYWGSWHDRKCKPVKADETFIKVRQFIIKHNLDNATFLILAQTYLHNGIVRYENAQGNLFDELEHLLQLYNVDCTRKNKNFDTSLMEAEILDLINVNDDNVQFILKKYNLTTLDLIVLIKTNICYRFDPMFMEYAQDGLLKDILYLEYINKLSLPKKDVLKYIEKENKAKKQTVTLKRSLFKKDYTSPKQG